MAPIEAVDARLRRFLVNSPEEVFGTVLDSIHSFFTTELETAGKQKLEGLVFLGTHAVMQTVAEKMFGKRGQAGTHFYLKNFVDHPTTTDRQFSLVAAEMHAMRNVKAHLWMASWLHSFIVDYRHPEGWKRVGGALSINPTVYLEQFLGGFDGPIWNWENLAVPEFFTVQKYLFLRDWLELQKGDPIRVAIEQLDPAAPPLAADEAAIQAQIKGRYQL